MWYQTVFLIASNVFFFVPSMLSFKRKLVFEGTIYSIIPIVSSIYHYVDSQKKCIVYTASHNYLCFSPTMSFLDFYYAYTIIYVTSLLWIHTSHNTRYGNFHLIMKSISNCSGNMIILFLILENFACRTCIFIVGGMCLVHLILAIAIFGLQVWKCHWFNFLLAVMFLITGIICFILSPKCYWIVHSIWHITIAIAIAFIIESHGKPCVKFTSNDFLHKYLKSL